MTLISAAWEDAALVAKLTELLSHENEDYHGLAVRALRRLGPRAAEATPALMIAFGAWAKGNPRGATFSSSNSEALVFNGLYLITDSNIGQGIIQAFGAIGPGAKDALPLLQSLGDHPLNKFAEQAIERITDPM